MPIMSRYIVSSFQGLYQLIFKTFRGYKSWHRSSRLVEAIENCANTHARPPDRLEQAKQFTRTNINNIVKELSENSIVASPMYVGSAFEDLKVNGNLKGQASKEIDVMLVWDMKDTVILKLLNEDRYICPLSLSKYFMETIQSYLRIHKKIYRNTVTEVKRHGSAIQMDVFIQYPKTVSMRFSVDIVPTLKLKTGKLYIPKEMSSYLQHFIEPDKKYLTWRRSFSLDEKIFIEKFNYKKQNRKNLLKILNIIKNKNPSLGVNLLVEMDEDETSQLEGEFLSLINEENVMIDALNNRPRTQMLKILYLTQL
ncbi:hypothetical protein HELRODRAFT_181014 [Helobdella robusta]|uniref:Uncharacterized protein n=1 Tax=Helobdella robusta TaxID=6412 RepID=T1FGJ1_HELRO|nr:hypothetical protein HELRODRAFT_181014 [Helobdella robusta]ESN93470.1 hypothetical protein HELRODRAFT_181014 [Helobdella robusta]